jgi:hypothetical protein
MTSIFRNSLSSHVHSVCSVAIWLAASAVVFGQPTASFMLTGEVRSRGSFLWNEQTVVLESAAGGAYAARTFLRPDGSFEIRDVPGGTYQISVKDGRGDVIWHELVPIGPGGTPLVIHLDDEVRTTERAETVSVGRLRQKPSRAALRELHLADKASREAKPLESIAHLRKAVELAPEMQDARNNLGAKYLQFGDYSSALRELETAVKLDSEAPIPHVNLALALLAVNRENDAENQARIALRRDPLSAQGNFAMGVSLDRQGKSGEALRYLEKASARVPQALLIQARILVERVETKQAAAKLREYLAKPGVSKRVETARWLQTLVDAETR